MTDTPTPPPHLLKKFSAEARAESSKRNGAGYLKTFARLCIEWANSKSSSNFSQIRSSGMVPPSGLVQQWWAEETYDPFGVAVIKLATCAAQWGADQELRACCEWLEQNQERWEIPASLRAARRPKPPSLKQQALEALEDGDMGPGASLTPTEVSIIRRALDLLPSDDDDDGPFC